MAAKKTGCPKHPGSNRQCIDARCTATWKVPGAPTADEQLRMWVEGESVCPNQDHECCPDFSCCKPQLRWPKDKRVLFAKSTQRQREGMLMGALGSLLSGNNVYITGGSRK